MVKLSDVVDLVLDRTVVVGYSRFGYALRRPHFPADPPPGSLAGRVVVITGAGRGIGATAALELARLGATVHLVVRAVERASDAVARIRAEVPDASVHVEVCDVSDLDKVREFTDGLRRRVPVLDVLIHNAGVLPDERVTTRQGHELTLATHVLGPFALTQALLPALRAAGPGRVLFVSSGGMYAQALHTDDPEYRTGTYKGATAYARTKRMQVVLAELLAERIDREDVVVHAMHPGWADTPGIVSSLPGFTTVAGPILRTAEQGADTIVWLAAAAEPVRSTGRFWHDRVQRPTQLLPWTRQTPEQRAELWRLCGTADLATGS